MSAARLNREVVLEAPTRVADGAGGFAESWGALGALWAEVKPRSGRLVTGEATTLSARSHRIIVRGAPVGQTTRPIPGQRFVMGARVFRIDAVTEEEPKGLYLICDCEEEVAV